MARWTALYGRSAIGRFALRLGVPAMGLIAALEPVKAHQPHDPMSVVAVSPDYAQDQTIFVGTNALTTPLPTAEFVPMVSTNGGFTFSVMPGLPNQPVLSISFSPGFATDNTAFMAGAGGLFMTTNRGSSWSAAGTTTFTSGVQAVATAPNFTAGGSVFAITIAGVYGSLDHGNTWGQLGTPSPLSSNLSVLAVSPNYTTDRTLAVGSVSDGIFISTNHGQSWKQATAGLTLPQVRGIAFSPVYSTDKTIFAATQGNGVYVTTNGGTTWTQVNSGITDKNATAIAVSPTFSTDSTLWVATAGAGVFQSKNRGTSWTVTGTVPRPLSNQTNIHYTTLAAASNKTLFLGMFEGLWTSTNGGTSWTYCDTIPTRIVRSMHLSPSYPSDHTVFVSTYGGGTVWSVGGVKCPPYPMCWNFKNTGLNNSYTDATAVSPNFDVDKTAFVGTTAGLEKISGGGSTWSLVGGLPNAPGSTTLAPTFPRSLGISPAYATDSTIFVGTHLGISYQTYVYYNNIKVPNQGLFVAGNGGQNWVPAQFPAPYPAAGPPIDAIAVSPNFASDRTVFAGSTCVPLTSGSGCNLAGLFKSTDGGLHFTQQIQVAPSANNDPSVLPIAISPAFASDQTVFVSTGHSGLFKSTNGGGTWTELPGTTLLTAFSIAISPNYAKDQTLFIGTMQQGLLKSTDGGTTFTAITAVPGNYVTNVDLSSGYATDRTVIVASYLGIYKSTDGGTTWIYTDEPARQEEERQVPPGPFFTIQYQPAWTIVHDAGASTVQLASTTQSGATARLTFMGSGAEWIGLKSPVGGTATVTLDGSVVATVSLQSSTNQEQQVLWHQRGLACGVHTVTITAQPAAGQGVNLDALDVWQNGCSFVAPQ